MSTIVDDWLYNQYIKPFVKKWGVSSHSLIKLAS